MEKDERTTVFPDSGKSIAPLAADWYIHFRNTKEVAAAMSKVQKEHLLSVVRNALDRNKANGRRPAKFEDFALAINRDRNNVRRRDMVPAYEYYAMAAVLDIPVHSFFLDDQTWLAKTIRKLVPESTDRGASVTAEYCHAATARQTPRSAAEGNQDIIGDVAIRFSLPEDQVRSIVCDMLSKLAVRLSKDECRGPHEQ